MERQFKQRIDSLLKHAEVAITPTANGLLDRGDLIQIIGQFVAVTRSLMKANEQLESRAMDLTDRLRRTYTVETV